MRTISLVLHLIVTIVTTSPNIYISRVWMVMMGGFRSSQVITPHHYQGLQGFVLVVVMMIRWWVMTSGDERWRWRFLLYPLRCMGLRAFGDEVMMYGGYKAKKGVVIIITAWGKNSNETMKTAEERERTEQTRLTASMCHHDIRLTAFMGAVVYQIA